MKVFVIYSEQPFDFVDLARFHGIFASKEESEIGLEKLRKANFFKDLVSPEVVKFRVMECEIGSFYLDFNRLKRVL